MAFSDHGFASEIIARDGLAYKFDDIGCMEKFKKDNPEVQAVRVFYKDFDTKQWRAENTSVIVRTGIKTPMGSGKVAVADSSRANAIAEQYPPNKDISENSSSCGVGCCSSKEN
jgi:copper chaperone NosL